jgi:cytochrome b
MRDAPSASLPLRSVWDLPTRLFHWILLAAVVVAAATGLLLLPVWLNLHLWAGSVIIALLLFRLVWGFTGSTHSRFASFLYPPQEILAHLRGLLAGKADHATGHNPVGASRSDGARHSRRARQRGAVARRH